MDFCVIFYYWGIIPTLTHGIWYFRWPRFRTVSYHPFITVAKLQAMQQDSDISLSLYDEELSLQFPTDQYTDPPTSSCKPSAATASSLHSLSLPT